MASKDYYKVLELHPSASPVEIKSSYRRLAIKYHPDTNGDNEISHSKFKEIHEAYKVLSDDKQRQIYHQSMLSNNSQSQKKKPPISATDNRNIDTTIILKQGQTLRNSVSQMDSERMDKQSIYFKLQGLFSVYNIAILRSDNNANINRQLVRLTLDVTQYLPYQATQKISELLHSFLPVNDPLHRTIDKFVKQQKLYWIWSNFKLLFAFIVAAILCVLIYEMST